MSLLRLFVFDLDGTLVDSEEDLAASVNAMLASLGRLPLPVSQIRSYIGNGVASLVARALETSSSRNKDQDVLPRALAFFLHHYKHHKLDTTKLYPGVLRGLTELKARFPAACMAVLTNKPVKPAKEICDGLGIRHFFFDVVGGDSLPVKKPHPGGLLHLMEQASLEQAASAVDLPSIAPGSVVLVGDSPVDLATAAAAQTHAIACTWGLTAPERLLAEQPRFLARSPQDWILCAQEITAEASLCRATPDQLHTALDDDRIA